MATIADVEDFLDGLINDLTRLHVTAANWKPGDDGLDTVAGPIIERAQALLTSLRSSEQDVEKQTADEPAAEKRAANAASKPKAPSKRGHR